MNKIPSLNLQDFVSGNSAQQQQFIVDLGRAFEEIGFVAISGHYLNESLIDELYTQIKAFFDLPEDIKKKYEIEGLGGQRGYTSFGKEHAKGKKEADLKEFWHFGQYAEVPEILKPHYPPNVMVEELPAFNEVGENVLKPWKKQPWHCCVPYRCIWVWINIILMDLSLLGIASYVPSTTPLFNKRQKMRNVLPHMAI